MDGEQLQLQQNVMHDHAFTIGSASQITISVQFMSDKRSAMIPLNGGIDRRN